MKYLKYPPNSHLKYFIKNKNGENGQTATGRAHAYTHVGGLAEFWNLKKKQKQKKGGAIDHHTLYHVFVNCSQLFEIETRLLHSLALIQLNKKQS